MKITVKQTSEDITIVIDVQNENQLAADEEIVEFKVATDDRIEAVQEEADDRLLELQAAAEQFLDEYVCVAGSTFDECFCDANDLVCNAADLLADGETDSPSLLEALITANKIKENFQSVLATGHVELVAIYDLDRECLAETLPYPCEPVPLTSDEIGNLVNCAQFGAGSSYLINECVPSVLVWEFDNPILLQSEDDLIAWLDRIYDELELNGGGFLKVRVPSGELITVFGHTFDAWLM